MTISTTPNLALPWPNNDEAVTNGWDAIRDLAVALDTYLTTGHLTALDPIVRQSAASLSGPGSLWTLGDFGVATQGASGDTGGWYRTREGIVDGWALAVQNGNGPSFPPTAAANTWVKLPVACPELPHRMPVGSYSYWSFDRTAGAVSEGELLLDKYFIAGEYWGQLTSRLNSNNQYSLAVHWEYPVDLP